MLIDLKKKDFIFSCVSVHICAGNFRSLKRATVPLDPEFQAVESRQIWALGTELRFS